MPEASDQKTSTEQPPAPIRWLSWPARDNAAVTSLVVVGLLAAAVVICMFSGRLVLAFLVILVLVAALWRFFLPVEFELSEKGVRQRLFGRQRHIPWQVIRRYEVCSAGVLLLPHEDRSVMAAFRGLYLPWKTHRDEVLAHIHHYLDRADKA
jgi:hypothetical protein